MVGVELEKATVLLSCNFGVLGFGLSESHSLPTMEVCESLGSQSSQGYWQYNYDGQDFLLSTIESAPIKMIQTKKAKLQMRRERSNPS